MPYEGRARHPRAARRHAPSARLGADPRRQHHHRACRRHRRRRDFARARRPVRALRRARRDRPRHLRRAQRASRAIARGGDAARHRLPRHRHEPEMDARRDAGDAQGPLPHHGALHAEGRQARPRHDVPHLHRAGESRFLVRSRHGEEAAGRAGAAAGGDRAVRELAVHRGQAERLSLVPRRDLARHRSRPHRHAAVRLRGRHGLRALRRLRARRAHVLHQARRQATSTSPVPRSAICWRASIAPCPASAPRSPTGPII